MSLFPAFYRIAPNAPILRGEYDSSRGVIQEIPSLIRLEYPALPYEVSYRADIDASLDYAYRLLKDNSNLVAVVAYACGSVIMASTKQAVIYKWEGPDIIQKFRVPSNFGLTIGKVFALTPTVVYSEEHVIRELTKLYVVTEEDGTVVTYTNEDRCILTFNPEHYFVTEDLDCMSLYNDKSCNAVGLFDGRKVYFSQSESHLFIGREE